jgi:hypothetical protein
MQTDKENGRMDFTRYSLSNFINQKPDAEHRWWKEMDTSTDDLKIRQRAITVAIQ